MKRTSILRNSYSLASTCICWHFLINDWTPSTDFIVGSSWVGGGVTDEEAESVLLEEAARELWGVTANWKLASAM